jgi:hypothetical protein
MKRRIVPILLALLVLALVGTVTQAGSSPNYAINWDVVGRAGPVMSSPHYAIQSTVGQTAIGAYRSPGYSLGAGYWQGYSQISFPSNIYLPIVTKDYTH